MTLDELITNASPEQLREALRELATLFPQGILFHYPVYFAGITTVMSSEPYESVRLTITNALEGKE